MATKKKGSVKLAGRFPVGTEVGLYRRHADILHPGTPAIKKGKVNDHGEVEFKALDPGEALFVAGYVGEDWRFVSVTASGVPADPDAPKPLTDKQVAEVLTQTRPSTEDRTVIGARNTANAKVERGGAPNRSSSKRTQARKRAAKPGTKTARKKTAQAAEKQPAPKRNTRKPAGTDPLAGRPGAKGRQRKR
jgi:hypothetical protein